MVKIIGFNLRENYEGRKFYALTLQGELEIHQSANGGSYMTARKCSIPTTFDEATCQSLIGQDLPGLIKKIEDVEPYEYTVPSTGEVIFLTHRYEYVKDETPAQDFTKVYNHSQNGIGHVEMA